MKAENEKLIIDGNTIYELDLECLKRKSRPGSPAQKPRPSAQKARTQTDCRRTKDPGQPF